MKDLRELALARRSGPVLEVNGVPELPNMSEINEDQQIIELTITNMDGQNITDDFARGLRRNYGTSEANWIDGQYGSLERLAEIGRPTMEIGFQELNYYIAGLHNSRERPLVGRYSGRAFIVAITLFSEAARFSEIEAEIRNNIYDDDGYTSSFRFNQRPRLLALTNNWRRIGNVIRSAASGTLLFYDNLEFLIADNEDDSMDRVQTARRSVSVIPSSCFATISSLGQIVYATSNENEYCPAAARTERYTHIVGHDDMCVHLDGSNFVAASYLCDDVWMYTDDKRIKTISVETDEVCIHAVSSEQGSELILESCTDDNSASIWDVRDNGVIAHKETDMVWTIEETNTRLVLQPNHNRTNNAWVFVGTYVVPEMIISTLDGLCLSSIGADESKKSDLCLINRNNTIISDTCLGNAEERWVLFEVSGAFKSLVNNWALTIGDNSSNLVAKPLEMIGPFTASKNQTWSFSRNVIAVC
ncbi:hypothetical protein ACFE04_020587 [Oxalis oulophora]